MASVNPQELIEVRPGSNGARCSLMFAEPARNFAAETLRFFHGHIPKEFLIFGMRAFAILNNPFFSGPGFAAT
ncbi:hypothetical protein [Paraburkholderia sp. BCC1886]|uniref:hypothetical protein n=1 Tax=Paraburkholderia sp. BCC1886 TaxID=2562670 RepID=UPI001642A35F|nr:hypothetical protein [Paraburkholderia sp. BCC1886]